jgi:hypothetical protein
MDAMALLCMLHANGPATLKTLRQAGCSSLETIETMEEERLSKVLGAPAAAARRFAREARHLRERLGQGILDREESPGDPMAPLLVPTAYSGNPSGSLASEAVPPVEDRSPSVMPWASTDAVEEALAVWRSRDLQELSQADAGELLAASEEVPSSRPARARPEFEFGAELAAAMREIATPDASSDPMLTETRLEPTHSRESDPKPGLNPGEVDGLDEELCRTFASTGILALEDLAGSIEMLVFPDAYRKLQDKVKMEVPVLIRGGVRIEEGANPKLTVNDITPLEEAKVPLPRSLRIRIPLEKSSETTVDDLHLLFSQRKGDAKVLFDVEREGDFMVVMEASGYNVLPDRNFIGRVEELCGRGAVRVID